MKGSKLANARVEDLLRSYSQAAAAHGKATEEGDHKTANKMANMVSSVYSELRRRGAEAQRALLPLLHNENPGVRLWVASHALEFSPIDGEPVLVELASTYHSFTGMTAQVTLSQWREGKLRFA
jgi:hypothetical protein